MSGYYNNTCRVEDLLINKYKLDEYQNKFIYKFISQTDANILYPARFEPIDEAAFLCKYPEGGHDSKYPVSLNLAEGRYTTFVQNLKNEQNSRIPRNPRIPWIFTLSSLP